MEKSDLSVTSFQGLLKDAPPQSLFKTVRVISGIESKYFRWKKPLEVPELLFVLKMEKTT